MKKSVKTNFKQQLPLIGVFVALLGSSTYSMADVEVNAADDLDDGVCDASHCSFREALDLASGGEEITFAPALAGSVIQMTDAATIGNDVDIDGRNITLQTNIRLLVAAGATAAIRNMTIIGPEIINRGSLLLQNVMRDASGVSNGIQVQNGSDTVIERSVITGGSSLGDGRSGVYAAGGVNLEIRESLIHGNSADGAGAGILVAGNENSTIRIINSTITDNHTNGVGGAIAVYGGTTEIINSTISNNSASVNSGAISIRNAGVEVYLQNSIVAGNSSSNAGSQDCIFASLNEPYPTSRGGNVLGPSCLGNAQDVVVQNATGVLEALADNGGPTMTHALSENSVAIDAGDNTVCGSERLDQRGAFGSAGMGCDAGAYESGPSQIAVIPGSVDFGVVAVGDSASAELTVVNFGNSLLDISSIDLPSGDFSLSGSVSTVDFDEQATLTVSFSPSAGGAAAADLTLNSNDPNSPAFIVALSGEGEADAVGPLDQINDIIAFYNASIADGSIEGTSNKANRKAKREAKMLNKLQGIKSKIERSKFGKACRKSKNANLRSDGQNQPKKDWVQGASVPTLMAMIDELRQALECS